MAEGFKPAFSDEMIEQITLDVYEYVKLGELSKKKVIGVSREMIGKRDADGNLIYYDIRFEGNEKPIGLDTMIGRIRTVVQSWKKYIAPLMETMLIEAAYKHAVKAKDSTASFKMAAEVILPKESADDETKPALSPGVVAILQQSPVGTTIHLGQGGCAAGVGDKGHERPDTGDIVADGQRQDITLGTVPLTDDIPVHEMHERGDTTERHPIPDTEMASEDTVDNNGGADMGSPE